MTSEVKLSIDEIDKVKDLQTRFNDISTQLGQIKVETIRLTELENTLVHEYKSLISLEKSISDDIQKKYGEGILNIDSGVYTVYQQPV